MVKRIIPCLDVKDGRVVKGAQFTDLRDAGNPAELACYYDRSGADELAFLDITASHEKRKTMKEIARGTAAQVSIPFIIGGGISTLDHMQEMLEIGADKVLINTSAVEQPFLIEEAAKRFGRQRIVVAIDAQWSDVLGTWEVYTHGARQATGIPAVDWSRRATKLGAGEILLTGIEADGSKDGYDIKLTRAVAEAINIPVIASGGAGELEHFAHIFTKGKADAALAASVFHYRKYTIKKVKDYLKKQGIEVKPV